MSAPVHDEALTRRCNELMGQELGRNQYGKPYYTWRWSNDLFWPAHATGQKVVTETKVKMPIIGAPAETHDFEEGYDAALDTFDNDWGGGTGKCKVCGEPESSLNHNVYSIMQDIKPEYRREPLLLKTDTWVICKWMSPWELILGPGKGHGHIRHGEQQSDFKEPPMEEVRAAWERQNPGAEFPSRGWRIPTSAYLPKGPEDENWEGNPFGHTKPNMQDTRRFIALVKHQAAQNFDQVNRDWVDGQDKQNDREARLIGEECANEWSAFLNPAPGKRGRASGGGFVSMPWSKFDRMR